MTPSSSPASGPAPVTGAGLSWLPAAEHVALICFVLASLLSYFMLQTSIIALTALVAIETWRRGAKIAISWREPVILWLFFVLAMLAVTLVRGAWEGLERLWPFLTPAVCQLALDHTGDARRRVARAFVAAAVLISIYAVVQSFTGIDFLLIGAEPRPLQRWMGGHLYKADGFFRHHAILAISLIPAWFVALKLFTEKRSAARAAPLLAIGLGLLSTGSLTGLAGWAVGLGVFIGVRFLPRRLELAVLVAALALPAALIALSYTLPRVPGTVAARHYIWGVAARVLPETHLLGGGSASFRLRAEALMREDPELVFKPSYSMLTTRTGDKVGVNVKHSHNQFLDILLEGGAAALAAFIAFLWMLIRNLRRASLVRRAPLLALVFGVVITFYSDCPFKHHNSLFVLCFAFAYCLHLAREPEHEPA